MCFALLLKNNLVELTCNTWKESGRFARPVTAMIRLI